VPVRSGGSLAKKAANARSEEQGGGKRGEVNEEGRGEGGGEGEVESMSLC